ncbi:hypothetical protein BO71DRAFT_320799 [Aspergillus ellipticus CBS 707.79]|uniref:MFS general substrate transporter n=1 Tax=Aspergillus ellipticus CBS 707.79 TaxID=1448320 RepID=A0A319DYD8_9EURO|nr:hypothetical protein BO71DRAFT_320799 [Aspergillus ellipticus CBS 707.79]
MDPVLRGEGVRPGKNRIHAFYRSSLFNAIIVGLVSFTQPGIWTALSSLGAGGLATPFFANAANVITFAIMVFMSPVFAVLGNRWSLKWVLVIGTLGYAPFSASLYANSVYGTQWFMLFGAATCGFSAAALWVSEAAIGVGYPEEHRKGVYRAPFPLPIIPPTYLIAIWFALNKIGSIIGTSIELALNLDDNQQGSISPKTYLVLIALQCLGLPLSLLISPIDKLIRTDGTKPTQPPRTTLREGFHRFWLVCKRPEIAVLVPIFLTSQWAQTYEGNYLTAYFTVRARALAAFIITWVGLAINLLLGYLLDNTRLIGPRSTRARSTWILIVLMYTITYVYNIVVQVEYQKPNPTFDITDAGFGKAVAVYCIFFIPYNAFAVWGYWVLGCFDSRIENLTFSTALLRGGESLASTISYGLGASENVSLLTNLLVAAVLFWISVPSTTWSAWRVGEGGLDGSVDGESQRGSRDGGGGGGGGGGADSDGNGDDSGESVQRVEVQVKGEGK